MFRRIAAASFLTVWFVLLGIDIAGDMGWNQNRPMEMDTAVDAILGDFGEAIKNSADSQSVTAYIFRTFSEAFSLPTPKRPSIDGVVLSHLQIQTPITVERFKTHNFLQVFLI